MSAPQLPPLPATLPTSQAEWQAVVNIFQQWQALLNGLLPPAPNGYSATFKTGQLRFTGPNGTVTQDINFEVGTNLPNPSGAPGAALFLGSGGGSFTASISGTQMTVTSVPGGTVIPLGAKITGTSVATGTYVTSVPGGGDRSSSAGVYTVSVSQTVASETMAASVSFNLLTDAPYDDFTPGNDFIFSAGESDGAQPGGNFTILGGGSASGSGGTAQWQGGTSTSGPGGPAVLQGGNSTSGIPGDAFVSGGQAGSQGANVHLIMTTVSGTSGVVRIRNNSTPIMDVYADGSIYLYLGGGFGTSGQHLTTQGSGLPAKWA